MASISANFKKTKKFEPVISIFAEDNGEFDSVNSQSLCDSLFERISSKMTTYIDTKLAPILDSLSSVSQSTKNVDMGPQSKRRKTYSSSVSRSRSRSPVPLTSRKSRLTTSKRPRSPASSKSRSLSRSSQCYRKARYSTSRPLYRHLSQSVSRSWSRSPDLTSRKSRKVISRRPRSPSI